MLSYVFSSGQNELNQIEMAKTMNEEHRNRSHFSILF